MKREQLESLRFGKPFVVGVSQLTNLTPRTLLYGYTTDRHTWHVYLDASSEIHCVCYTHNRRLLSHTSGPTGGVEHNQEYVPNKRLYPESCDYEFCQALMNQEVNLPFTTYDDEGESKRLQGRIYAGYAIEELVATAQVHAIHLAEATSAYQAHALISQAAMELNIAHETATVGVIVDAAAVQAVIDRADALAKDKQYIDISHALHTPERLAGDLLEELTGYSWAEIESSSVTGGILQVRYSFRDGIDEASLMQRGFIVTHPTEKSRRVQGNGIDVVMLRFSGDGILEEDGFLLQHLFGKPGPFEDRLRLYSR